VASRRTEFDEWWAAYPKRKRTGKRNAQRKWDTAVREGVLPALAELLAALEVQAAAHDWTKEGGRFVPLPQTYLHQGQWDGAEAAAQNQNGYRPKSKLAPSHVVQAKAAKTRKVGTDGW
jgi:hypothetical protein